MEKKEITIDKDISLSFIGPSLKEGPCPTVLYFASTKEDSLALDPINQPAKFLSSYPLRVFSLSLPGHEECSNPKHAISLWSKDLLKEKDIISPFVKKVEKALAYLIDEKIASPSKIAVVGLSRGAFISFHVAAKCREIKYILAFAPLIDLYSLSEFASIKDNLLIQSLHPNKLSSSLIEKEIRMYIGNNDTRVGTQNAFSFIEKLNEAASINKKKSSAELIVHPSIGYKGHGTEQKTFKEGCQWLIEKILKGDLKV